MAETTHVLKPLPRELPPFYVGAVLLGRSGDLLLQLRDNLSWIVNPGKIATFGGGGEEGETPVEAIMREVKEEIGVALTADDFFFLFESVSRFEGGITRVATIFGAFDVPDDNLVITEGQLVRLKPEDFPIDNMTPGTLRAIPAFFEECAKRGLHPPMA